MSAFTRVGRAVAVAGLVLTPVLAAAGTADARPPVNCGGIAQAMEDSLHMAGAAYDQGDYSGFWSWYAIYMQAERNFNRFGC